jgi:hypothetical protein
VTTLQVPLQLHGQTEDLPHHDARHGTVEMWMPPMKMDLRCPSTPATPWQALGILRPRGDLPWAWQ